MMPFFFRGLGATEVALVGGLDWVGLGTCTSGSRGEMQNGGVEFGIDLPTQQRSAGGWREPLPLLVLFRL